MKALVTGGAGFIGSAIARRLLDEDASVRVLDNFISSDPRGVPKGAELIEGDLRDAADVERACSGVDVIFHQAALRSVPRSLEEPVLVHECNVSGTLNLIRAAQMAGVDRLVYASSSSVYGGIEEGRSHEDDPVRPRSPYAASKLAAEY